MVITKIKFCRISHKPNDKSIKDILEAIKNAEIENQKIFKIKPNKYSVKITYSKKEFDIKTGIEKIKNPHRGTTVLGNQMIIFSPSLKELTFSLKSFFFHEVNHIFYNSLVGHHSPIWFSEGMATFLMKEYDGLDRKAWKKYLKNLPDLEKYLYYRYFKEKYDKTRREFYPLVYLMYGNLHNKYGQKKILKFLREFSKKPSKKEFEKLFLKHFNKTQKEILYDSLK